MKLTPQAPFEPALRQIIGDIRDCGVKHYLRAHRVDVKKAEAAHQALPPDRRKGTADLFLMAIALGQHVLDETDSPTSAVRELRLVDADVEEPWTDLPTEPDKATGDQAFVRGLTDAGIEKLIARILSTNLLPGDKDKDKAMRNAFELGFENRTKFDILVTMRNAFELAFEARTKFDILVNVFRCGFTYGTRLRIHGERYEPLVVRDPQPRWLWLTCGWDKGQEPWDDKSRWALSRLAVQLAFLETSGTRDMQWWPVVSDARPGDIVVVQLRPFDEAAALSKITPPAVNREDKKDPKNWFHDFNPVGFFDNAKTSVIEERRLLRNDAPLGLAVVTSPALWNGSSWEARVGSFIELPWPARKNLNESALGKERREEGATMATNERQFRVEGEVKKEEEKLLPELRAQQILDLKTTLLSAQPEDSRDSGAMRAILSSLAILSQNLSESHPLPDCYMVAPSYNEVSECAFFLATGPSELDLGTHPLKILDALPRKRGDSKFIIKVPYCPDLFLEFTPEMPPLPPGKTSKSFLNLPLDPLGLASTDVYIADGNEKLMALVTNASGVDDAVALFAIRKAIFECRSSRWPRWQSRDDGEWAEFRDWLRRAGYYGSTG